MKQFISNIWRNSIRIIVTIFMVVVLIVILILFVSLTIDLITGGPSGSNDISQGITRIQFVEDHVVCYRTSADLSCVYTNINP